MPSRQTILLLSGCKEAGKNVLQCTVVIHDFICPLGNVVLEKYIGDMILIPCALFWDLLSVIITCTPIKYIFIEHSMSNIIVYHLVSNYVG